MNKIRSLSIAMIISIVLTLILTATSISFASSGDTSWRGGETTPTTPTEPATPETELDSIPTFTDKDGKTIAWNDATNRMEYENGAEAYFNIEKNYYQNTPYIATPRTTTPPTSETDSNYTYISWAEFKKAPFTKAPALDKTYLKKNKIPHLVNTYFTVTKSLMLLMGLMK